MTYIMFQNMMLLRSQTMKIAEAASILVNMMNMPFSPPSPPPRQALIFDLETTGLIPPKNKNNYDDFPYITQFTIIIYDLDSDKILRTYNHYIKLPENVIISKVVENITGINTDMCNKYGVDILYVLQIFYEEYIKSEYIVAHNMDFDSKVLHMQYVRAGDKIVSDWRTRLFSNLEQIYCTMRNGKAMLEEKMKRKLGYRPNLKYPKLQELLYDLFPEDFYNSDGAGSLTWHNSFIDSIACMKCFIKMHLNKNTNIDIYHLSRELAAH